jgi:hypothetical protein
LATYSEGRLLDSDGGISFLLRMGIAHEASGGDQSRSERSVKAHNCKTITKRRMESGEKKRRRFYRKTTPGEGPGGLFTKLPNRD